ncbi:UPF0488 protein C8orf33 homolog [Carcharodon carcharias]|uniref:UPF0488 protein C8orf33 homolog n=1 Tax=Carcharodon carcharias TaxID=13397 RepID=UPI001B7E4E1F|nr:UPF0488 protein C8orf33 homolog [Carcharodon carcharias]
MQEELDCGVQQMQTGVFQLKLSPGQALNLTPAAIQQTNSTDSGHVAHEECSRSFNQSQSFTVPKGTSDDPTETHPACGHLNFDTSNSSHQPQAGSGDAVNEDSDRVLEKEKLKIFAGTKSQESDFKFNFAIPEADAELQQANCTGRPVSVVQNAEAKADPILLSHQKAKQVMASKPSQKKKNKVRSSKHTAEPARGGEMQSGESNGRERNSAAHGEGQCLSSDEQLRREVDWCIEQLELGLRTQKVKQKQADGALHALRTLRSEKAPLVKKRQVMRSIFGDYRKKMEEERQKQFRLMLAATKSAKIKPVGRQTKSKIFRKSVSKLTKSGDFPESDSMNLERSTIQCVSECDQDHQNHFRFNFF